MQLAALELACLRQGLGLGAVMEQRGLGSGEGVLQLSCKWMFHSHSTDHNEAWNSRYDFQSTLIGLGGLY